jgi:hypothetical protein
MIRTHDGSHGPDCFGCKVQSISFDPYAMPSRLNKKIPPRTPNPAWERGIPTDSRGMPFLRKDGTPMGVKEYSENRHQIEQHRRALHNSTDSLTPRS